jgi:ABC-type proline/glycine betaine transport system ATPase subunit
LLCPGQLRAVALVFQNFGLAPLIQVIRAILRANAVVASGAGP